MMPPRIQSAERYGGIRRSRGSSFRSLEIESPIACISQDVLDAYNESGLVRSRPILTSLSRVSFTARSL